jgi:hypothetical protein
LPNKKATKKTKSKSKSIPVKTATKKEDTKIVQKKTSRAGTDIKAEDLKTKNSTKLKTKAK